MSHKGFCDNCSKEGKVKKLSLGAGGNIYLDRGCWGKEMAWRKQRNKDLDKRNRFSILKFS